jgi:lipopolysaccharide biosynthesis glycosyltransferase
MGADIMIITGGTANYSAHINVLLSSLIHTNPNSTFIVGCFDWDDDLIQSFQDVYDVEFVKIRGNNSIREDVMNNQRSGDALKMKINFIHDIYKKYDHNGILWIDADTTVTKDLESLLGALESGEYDVMCTHRSHRKKSHTIFATGVLGFAKTDLADQFITEFNDSMKPTEGLEDWFHDQIEFYNIFNKLNPQLYALSKHEHTIMGDENAMIYSRREVIDLTPNDVADIHNIPIHQMANLPESIYQV